MQGGSSINSISGIESEGLQSHSNTSMVANTAVCILGARRVEDSIHAFVRTLPGGDIIAILKRQMLRRPSLLNRVTALLGLAGALRWRGPNAGLVTKPP